MNTYVFFTHSSTPECHQVWKSIDPCNYHHATAIHHQHQPGCVFVVTQVALIQSSSGFSNIYEGLLSSGTAALLGQTAPGPVHPVPINGTEVHYTHFSPGRRQLIFFSPSSSLNLRGAHCWGRITLACLRDCAYRGRLRQGGCTGVQFLCVCLYVCEQGCSQWPELEVIIMYRLVRCNANANAFSVAAAQVPLLCELGCYSFPIRG